MLIQYIFGYIAYIFNRELMPHASKANLLKKALCFKMLTLETAAIRPNVA